MPIRTPYNFVPLSPGIAEIEDAIRVSQDLPFSHGLSGCLDLELTTVTPTCVGGGQKRRKGDGPDDAPMEPFQTRGRFAIPGSSLKGMIRNVLEIAGFGRMAFVDHERRFAFRDLAGPMQDAYQSRLTEPGKDGKGFRAKSEAGWLREVRDAEGKRKHVLVPCELARIAIREASVDALDDGTRPLQSLEQLAAPSGRVPDFIRNPKCGSAAERYEEWKRAGHGLRITCKPDRVEPAGNVIKRKLAREVRFADGSPADDGECVEGVLVLTGSPSEKKNFEFVFHSPRTKDAIELTQDQVRTFQLNHSEGAGERHGGRIAPDTTRGYLEKDYGLRDEMGIPVFYLREGSDERDLAIGLASMFRLTYRHSVGDLLQNTHPYHLAKHAGTRLDLAEAIFGVVRSEQEFARKGRATFETFVGPRAGETRTYRGVLNGPKPTFVPAYVAQEGHRTEDRLKGRGRKPRYATYDDRGATLRGWKRYPVRSKVDHDAEKSLQQCKKNPKCNENVCSSWRAVPSGAVFRGRLRFHNLRPFELGALLWCLDFGGRPEHAHSLGYAKPFGFGAVRLEVKGERVRTVTREDPVASSSGFNGWAERLRTAFGEWLENTAGIADFEGREPIEQLLAMTDPRVGDAQEDALRYMERDDFRRAKQEGLVLSSFTKSEARPEPDHYPQYQGKVGSMILAELEREHRKEALMAMSPMERFRAAHSELYEDGAAETSSELQEARTRFIKQQPNQGVPDYVEKDADSWKAAVRSDFAMAFEALAGVPSDDAERANLGDVLKEIEEEKARRKKRGKKKASPRLKKLREREAELRQVLKRREGGPAGRDPRIQEKLDWWGWTDEEAFGDDASEDGGADGASGVSS